MKNYLLKLGLLLATATFFVFYACNDKDKEKTYTITYDLNGGTGTVPAPQTYTPSSTNFTLNDGAGLTKQGFTFGGWSIAADNNTPVALPYVPTTNITLYAVWIPITVTYDLNGGAGTVPAPQTYAQGSTSITLNNGAGLTKQGFTFGGWADTKTGTTPVAVPYAPTASATLYAIWVSSAATYTVSFNLNFEGSGTPPASQTYTAGGQVLSLPVNVTRAGHTFAGWARTADGREAVANPYTPAADITLYAIWVSGTAIYTVTYHANGGSGITPTAVRYQGGSPPIPLNNGAGLTNPGFTFGGWARTADGREAVANPYTPAADIILYAIWVAPYTVTYNLNGGSGTLPDAQTYSGTPLLLHNGSGLTKEGLTFRGWATTTDGTVAVANPYTPTANIILYAIWTSSTATYTVTYNLNGGTGTTPAPQTATVGTPVLLNDGAGLTKPNSIFRGWSTSPSGTPPVTLPYISTADVTLYAIWVADVTYTVTYNLNGGTGTQPEQGTSRGGLPVLLNNGQGLARTGFIFTGWADTQTGTTPVALPYIPTSNVTLYAIWTSNTTTYTVTYNLNEGTGTTPAPQTATVGNSIRLPAGAGLTRSGFVFAGWAISPNGTPPIPSEYYRPSANVTLYAVWGYTVTYNTSNATGTVPDTEIYSGIPLRLPNGSGLAKPGYAFMGWASSAGGTSPLTDPYTPTANVTLYAIWQSATSRTVTYNTNGATSGEVPAPQTYDGTPLALHPGLGFTKAGSTFNGWSSSASGTPRVHSPYTPGENVTLYAIWRAIPAASFTLSSTTYTNGGTIPAKCGGNGTNTSPQLSWTNAPTDSDVAMYVLVFFDDTVDTWHFRRAIPTSFSSLAEGAIPRASPPFDGTAYEGPAPGDGRTHTYQFKLYAVRTGYDLMNFGAFRPDGTGQRSWADLESANAEYIVDKSNAYSGTFAQ